MEVEYHEEFVTNSRGVQLFTCGWLPASASPKALVFLCHGYGMECSGYMRACGVRLAEAGYGVFGMDYEGHGKSMGKRCYIRSFHRLVDDCHRFFKSICGTPGGVQEQEPVPLRRVHGRRRRAPAAQQGPHLLGRRRPRRAHVQDIGEGEAASAGDHPSDAGGGRDPQVEDRPVQGRHRRRLQGPRQARKDQEEQAHLPGQAAAQDGAGDAQDQHLRGGQPVSGEAALLRAARRGRHGDGPGGEPRAVRARLQHRQDHQALPGHVARPHRRRARRERGGHLLRHRRVAQRARTQLDAGGAPDEDDGSAREVRRRRRGRSRGTGVEAGARAASPAAQGLSLRAHRPDTSPLRNVACITIVKIDRATRPD